MHPLNPRARWHQCDGADAYPPHRELHRRGFWSEGWRVVRFIERLCVYPEGPKAGEIVGAMIPWQREATFEIFRVRDADGLRQYRRALIGVAKKNNKTVWGAWLALYYLFDEKFRTPLIVCAASSDDQADLSFDAAKSTCESSPRLKEWTGGEGRGTRYESEIQAPAKPGAKLRRLAVGGGTLDGKNLVMIVVDELHEWVTPRARATFTVLNRGTILNPESLVLMITTAGWDPETIEAGLYEYGKAIENGDVDPDETFLFIWYEAPEVCSGAYEGRGPYEGAEGMPVDYRSREAFEAANPSAGITVTYERYLEDIKPPMTEAEAWRYHGNRHTEAMEPWLPKAWDTWAVGHMPPRPASEAATRRTFAMLDASTNYDGTVISWWEVVGTGWDIRIYSRSRVWERPIDVRTGEAITDWFVPQAEVEAHLFSMHFGTGVDETWSVNGACACCGEVFPPMGFTSIGYDPARVTLMTDGWRDAGLPMEEVPNSDSRHVKGFQTLYRLLTEDRITHDGNRAVRRHVNNSVAKWASSGGGRRLARRASSVRRPNDAAITLEIGGYLLGLDPEDEEEARGISVWVGDEEDGGE